MDELIYVIPKEMHNSCDLKKILNEHPEIRFVSLVGIDLGGNATDEKIPVKAFLEDLDDFLKNGIQTDGSSVVLHEIASLNNARVDLVPDLDVNWFIDYNYDYIEDNLPVGTLEIPSFLIHNGKRVDSRSILLKAVNNFKNKIMDILKTYPHILKNIGINDVSDIEDVVLTCATELEFWVKTPDDKADIEKLSTSQMLKEQYWKRTHGTVRTALEKTLILLDKYNLEPEMGHKEVGGVSSKISIKGKTTYVLEQLEVDWKYSNPIQAADNELIVREIVEDTFRRYGLEVTFMAKPLEGVAGNGEHTHVGVSVKLKDGKTKNLFSPLDMKKDYLSEIGYGALMGLLKNYEALNPFITSSNDAFNRLKPGFEAPVCIVASLGIDVENPTRNRSVLVGVIRDLDSPLATRFELRSPNPLSNTYLVIASMYQAMLDGILAVAKSKKSAKELEKEISKQAGDESFYLEKNRAYRSEEDVFEHFTEEERNALFSKPPATVYENILNLKKYEDKTKVLLDGDVFTEEIINSFIASSIERWETELKDRILVDNINFLRECKKVHDIEEATDLDIVRWEKINNLRQYMMKNSLDRKCLFTRLKEALDNKDYCLASSLQLEMYSKINEINKLYIEYKRNLFNI
ncbi:glutamine synthetase [Alkalithermobacter thermoalcaliphilus JW-YL-7 = DSM 7308]|uniref:glutamine synthetase n=1 Tax=Alkalithermobacter thermoalcaliphilus JW-YL-7 = DSM 7308 TaxID=1121328 RepID=A0A150FSH5_CLOPD|nr:glutamine synthetase catalytic region [[Clostridium] paradoxum JW-YL-7 = DSM 7308]SHK70924.1 glutamine synthetase [[Clostridium] paradoxum JW-YL-7 = DSM 7308]